MIARFLVWLMLGFALAMCVSLLADFLIMLFPRRNRKRKQTHSKYPDNSFIRRA